MRGTHSNASNYPDCLGIIPACAGNTDWTACNPHSRRDHPRVCGEHRCRFQICVSNPGSSPRVRGTQSATLRRWASPGIIPACAGNTLHTASRALRPRDHPRVCGEHTTTATGKLADQGSSPRVRGTQRLVRAPRPEQGIIPACAGNTRTVDVCRG